MWEGALAVYSGVSETDTLLLFGLASMLLRSDSNLLFAFGTFLVSS